MNLNNFKILNLSKGTTAPVFRENRNGRWIDYGKDNVYPQYLLDVYHNKSNKHKAIINKKVDMTSGNGIVPVPGSKEYETFILNIFGDNNVEEIMQKCNYDLELYNGFAVEAIWSKDGSRIAKINYLPFEKIRISMDTEIDGFYLSPDWKNYRKSENVPYFVPLLNRNLSKEYPSQVFYFTSDQPGKEWYPIPYYSSTLTWIESDWEISNFHYNSLINGFSAGFILNFATGIPEPEEMERAQREFEKNYSGTDNANKFILTFSEGQDGVPILTPIELNASDERFLILHKEIKEEIFTGHSVTSPMLFGIRQEGQLGGRNELEEALGIFQSTYINQRQKVLEKQFNKLARLAGVTDGTIVLEKYTL